ncbi:hypothetical protein D9M68_772010 [compost metagenome]
MLMVGMAMNDPSPMLLVKVPTFDECQTAVIRFELMSTIAQKQRDNLDPPDLYLTCKRSKKQGD